MFRSIITLLAILFALILSVPLSAQTPPSIDSFFQDAMFGTPSLSPSGRYVAVPDYRGETDQLAIIDLQNNGKMSHVDLGELELSWVRWGTDDRVLLGISLVEGIRSNAYYYRDENGDLSQTFKVRFRRVMSMERDGGNQATMFSNAGHRMKKTLSGARIVSTLPSDPNHILMSAEDKTFSLWKVNILTGDAHLIEKGTHDTYSWQLNSEGVPVVRLESVYNDNYARISVRAPGEEKWKKILTVKLKDVDSLRFVAATDNPTTYFVRARPEGYERSSIFKYDLKTKTILEQISSHDKVDIYQPLVTDAGAYFGSVFFEDRLKYEFVDPGLNKHMAGLNKFFDDEKNVFIQSSNVKGDKWILNIDGPREPGNYYIYDKTTRSVEHLLPGPLRLEESDLGRMQFVNYKSRDGLALTGYLTKPAKPKSSPAPLIVMPHGGPHVRDYFLFDKMAQFLATRGYQVFQPNFRGSAGFGETFKSSGYGEWGGKMQNDITDGVKHLIATGGVNPDKICIVGASYGGYAALMGAAQTPELYKCSVSISGVTDLLDMLKHDKDLYARLMQAGKSVDYLELTDTNHNLSGLDPKNKEDEDFDYAYKQALGKLEVFLKTNLPPGG